MKQEQLHRQWRYFSPWREAEYEQWLQQQGRRGLHVVRLNSFGFHVFRQGEPADEVYRWAITPSRERSHNDQLYQDAGWQQAAWVHGYQLWRKPADAGGTEIFTETDSKVRQHMLEMAVMTLGIFGCLAVALSTDFQRSSDLAWLALFGSFGAISLYTIIRLAQRALQLKRNA